MTLDELKCLEQQAQDLDRKAARAKASQEAFARLRTNGQPLYVELVHNRSLHYHEQDESFIQGIINEFGPEILRLAEMRKAAFERECRVKARAARESINSFLGSTEAA